MSSKILVIRNPKKRLRVFDTHILLDEGIIGYEQIDSIYLIKSHRLPISECFKLSFKVNLFLIDHNGYIKGKITRFKKRK